MLIEPKLMLPPSEKYVAVAIFWKPPPQIVRLRRVASPSTAALLPRVRRRLNFFLICSPTDVSFHDGGEPKLALPVVNLIYLAINLVHLAVNLFHEAGPHRSTNGTHEASGEAMHELCSQMTTQLFGKNIIQ